MLPPISAEQSLVRRDPLAAIPRSASAVCRRPSKTGGATTLNGDPCSIAASTVVWVGAELHRRCRRFINNLAGRRLLLSDGVLSGDPNVLLINQGLLRLGALALTGGSQGKDFQQTGTGTLHIDLGGVALNAFDRFNLTGAANALRALDLGDPSAVYAGAASDV